MFGFIDISSLRSRQSPHLTGHRKTSSLHSRVNFGPFYAFERRLVGTKLGRGPLFPKGDSPLESVHSTLLGKVKGPSKRYLKCSSRGSGNKIPIFIIQPKAEEQMSYSCGLFSRTTPVMRPPRFLTIF